MVGIVRTESSKAELMKATGASAAQVEVVDVVAAATAGSEDAKKLEALLKGAFGLVICTSATPKPAGPPDPQTKMPKFGYPNGHPYFVDWLGQKF